MSNVQNSSTISGTAYTLNDGDDVIYADTSSSAFTITLTNPTAAQRKPITVLVIGSSNGNTVTLSTPSGIIGQNGASTLALVTSGAGITLMPDGTNWQIINSQ